MVQKRASSLATVPVPNTNVRPEKITVITRDNIRTLKPLSDATLKAKQDIGTSRRTSSSSSSLSAKASRVKTPFSPMEETLKSVSSNVNKARPVNLGIGELNKVKNMSIFLSSEELLARAQESNNCRLDIIANAKARKAKLEEYDHKRSENAKLSELEKEAKEKASYLLSKAKSQLEEQEDEIKHLNELMLYAKCVVIRDAQVQEKKMILADKKEEEGRLDAMMELERVAELKKLEEREKKRVEELRKGASKIREQISERREAALLEQERKDQETKMILEHIADVDEQDKREKMEKVEAQRRLMQEVAKANSDSMDRKKQQKHAEEDEDRKVLQYLLDKEQREIENDKTNQHRKIEREKELSRLRALQEKMSDKQAAKDALRAQRAYESYEREWRRKEKEAAEKQSNQERELREDRLKQQKAREHAIAAEAHKMRIEFMDNIKRQKEIEEKIQEEERTRAEKNKKYSAEVKAQIEEKERQRHHERDEFFKEGVRLSHERKEKLEKINQIKERKLNDLKAVGVPERYCSEIERKTHLPDIKFSK